MELIPWFVTALISLFVGLEFGMMTGFLISVTYLLYYAARPGVKVKRGFTTNATEFVLIQLDRSLTFPSVEYIRYILIKASASCGKNNLTLVIDCHHVQFADFTAAQGLTDLIQLFKKRNQLILLWNAKESILRVFKQIDLNSHIVKTESQLEEVLDSQKSEVHVEDDHGIQIRVSKVD